MRSSRHNTSNTSDADPVRVSKATNTRRRGFLFALGAGGAGAAALAARSLSGVAPQSDSATPDDSQGYRVTDHIKRYYQSTKT